MPLSYQMGATMWKQSTWVFNVGNEDSTFMNLEVELVYINEERDEYHIVKKWLKLLWGWTLIWKSVRKIIGKQVTKDKHKWNIPAIWEPGTYPKPKVDNTIIWIHCEPISKFQDNGRHPKVNGGVRVQFNRGQQHTNLQGNLLLFKFFVIYWHNL